MNRTDLIITIAYGAAVIASLIGLVMLIRSTRPARQAEVDVEALAHREKGWAYVVIAFLVVLMAATVSSIPYADDGEAKGTQVVNVQGLQFAWVMKPNTVRAGAPVEFRLTSKDVQHNFALYLNHRLEVQVQVPAEGTQKLVHTFDDPGTYTIVCIEYCGLNHDQMQSKLRVLPSSTVAKAD